MKFSLTIKFSLLLLIVFSCSEKTKDPTPAPNPTFEQVFFSGNSTYSIEAHENTTMLFKRNFKCNAIYNYTLGAANTFEVRSWPLPLGTSIKFRIQRHGTLNSKESASFYLNLIKHFDSTPEFEIEGLNTNFAIEENGFVFNRSLNSSVDTVQVQSASFDQVTKRLQFTLHCSSSRNGSNNYSSVRHKSTITFDDVVFELK